MNIITSVSCLAQLVLGCRVCVPQVLVLILAQVQVLGPLCLQLLCRTNEKERKKKEIRMFEKGTFWFERL